ncbi:hypothetical protein SLA2020_268670 [Shorea laevis]
MPLRSIRSQHSVRVWRYRLNVSLRQLGLFQPVPPALPLNSASPLWVQAPKCCRHVQSVPPPFFMHEFVSGGKPHTASTSAFNERLPLSISSWTLLHPL